MRSWKTLLVIAGVALCGVVPMAGLAQQEGVGAKVGEKLSQAGQTIKGEARKVTDAVSKEFDKVRADVGKLGIHHRVYSRIHWDKQLHDSKIEVHLFKGGVVVLRGTVPNQGAANHALALAMETVDVTEVVNELVPAVKTNVPTKPGQPAVK